MSDNVNAQAASLRQHEHIVQVQEWSEKLEMKFLSGIRPDDNGLCNE